MTTTAGPIANPVPSAPASDRPKRGRRWIAVGVGAAAVVVVGVTTVAVVGRTESTAPAAVAATNADVDLIVHGTTGHLFTTRGVAIVPARAAVSDADVMVHGGPGSAVTTSGVRLR